MSAVIAARYARALMNLAAKDQQVDQAAQGLDLVADMLAESPRLAEALENVRATGPDKERTLQAVLDKAGVPALVATFSRYVLDKRRLRLLPDIRDQFHRLADERLGRAKAAVTVAAPLAKEQEASLKRKLEAVSGKTITLHVTVDPAILGGAVTRIGSTVWDGSLRHQLNRIRESIVKE